MKTQDVLSILVSVLVLILIAAVEKQSKSIAAITATMPVNITLAFWIVYSANNGDQATMERFSRGLLLALVPTFCFVLTLWLASRAGLKLLPVLLISYSVWVLGVVMIWILRKALGT
jgi:hypothetical protein